MKIRFKDFKIDFSKSDVISTVCFTVVMILVLVLGNCFGYVNASSYEYCLNSSDFTNSSFYDSSVLSSYIDFASRDNISSSLYKTIYIEVLLMFQMIFT